MKMIIELIELLFNLFIVHRKPLISIHFGVILCIGEECNISQISKLILLHNRDIELDISIREFALLSIAIL